MHHKTGSPLSTRAPAIAWYGCSGKGNLIRFRDAMRMVERDGWSLVRTRGSHRQFRHPNKPGTVTIAGKLSDDLPRGTWASIMKQAGLKGE